jgi:hypothetical protein
MLAILEAIPPERLVAISNVGPAVGPEPGALSNRPSLVARCLPPIQRTLLDSTRLTAIVLVKRANEAPPQTDEVYIRGV